MNKKYLAAPKVACLEGLHKYEWMGLSIPDVTCADLVNFNLVALPSIQFSQNGYLPNLSPFNIPCFSSSNRPFSLICPSLLCHKSET